MYLEEAGKRNGLKAVYRTRLSAFSESTGLSLGALIRDAVAGRDKRDNRTISDRNRIKATEAGKGPGAIIIKHKGGSHTPSNFSTGLVVNWLPTFLYRYGWMCLPSPARELLKLATAIAYKWPTPLAAC